MLLTETNIPDEAHCYNRLGYKVLFSQAVGTVDGGAQGGASLVVRERPKGWSVDSTRFHEMNVVS